MRYSKAHRQKAVQIASQHAVLSAAMPDIRKALKSPDLTEKTVRRWLKHGEDQSVMNNRQQAFVLHYLQCWNATKAAKLAGYSEKTAYSYGQQLLNNLEVKTEIETHFNAMAMSAAEVLARLSGHARGDLSEFIGLSEDQIKEHPQAWLLKKYKRREQKDGEIITEIEIHDPQAAQVHLGRYHKLFVDKGEFDLTSKGKPLFNADMLHAITQQAADELKEWGSGDGDTD